MLMGCGTEVEREVPSPRVVETITLSEDSTQGERLFIGEIQAADRADLSFETGGMVTHLDVELGDIFVAGQTLGLVDDQTMQLDLQAREAELRDAQARLSEAQLDYDRRASLDGTGAVSRSAIDAATARRDSAQAAVAALRAQVARAKEMLADTRLIAPYDGKVAERMIEPSQVVQPGQPVLRITGIDSGFEAVIHMPERFLDSTALGRETTVVLKPSNQIVPAVVSEVGASANGSGLFPITLTITDNAHERLRAGVRVEVSKPVSTSEGILVPLSAVRAGPEGQSFLMVYTDEGVVEQRAVQLGAVDGAGARILQGAYPGDTIVTKGVGLLKNGETVQPARLGVTRFNP